MDFPALPFYSFSSPFGHGGFSCVTFLLFLILVWAHWILLRDLFSVSILIWARWVLLRYLFLFPILVWARWVLLRYLFLFPILVWARWVLLRSLFSLHALRLGTVNSTPFPFLSSQSPFGLGGPSFQKSFHNDKNPVAIC
jgi:hypothetical protein